MVKDDSRAVFLNIFYITIFISKLQQLFYYFLILFYRLFIIIIIIIIIVIATHDIFV